MRCFLVRSVGKLGVNYLNTQEEYGKLSHYHLEVMKANEKKVCNPKQLGSREGNVARTSPVTTSSLRWARMFTTICLILCIHFLTHEHNNYYYITILTIRSFGISKELYTLL